jgi:hypothetical protein
MYVQCSDHPPKIFLPLRIFPWIYYEFLRTMADMEEGREK